MKSVNRGETPAVRPPEGIIDVILIDEINGVTAR